MEGLSWPWSYCSWIYNYNLQSVPITFDVVSLNLDQGEVYNITMYVIKFVSDLR
jgi:hypothetical protein